ncbi:MAG: response regulator transcription factor [bacterium]
MKENFLGKISILLVEDENSLAAGLKYNLQEEGYEVIHAEDGRKALDLIAFRKFDLIILDIMLPYHDGFEIACKIREKSPQMPILMLTARTDIKDRVKGLEIGADDYVTKPFHLDELLLRIKGILKRKQWYQTAPDEDPVYTFGKNKINFDTMTCRAGKKTIQLTYYEAMVMKYFVEHEEKIVSRKELLENVWNITEDIETRTVDNFILRLRKYFEPKPSKPKYIRSVRSAGYIFER